MAARSSLIQSPRILIAGHLPPPMGGMATYYQTLLQSSLPRRSKVRFVQTSSQKRELIATGRLTASNLGFALQDCLRFFWAVLSYRPQLCHLGTASGLSFLKNGICVVIARLLGSRVLLQPHCSFNAVFVEHSKRWRSFFLRIIGWTDGVLALSSEWQQLSTVAPECAVHYLPNAIDLDRYRSIAEEQLGRTVPNGPFRILYLGHLGQAKGSFDLVCAAHELRQRTTNVVFDLVGDELSPGERGKLEAAIADRNLNCVSLYPPASTTEKLEYFRVADVFVYPSYYEGMPMAVLEAMACGLPIVATRVGGLPDIVGEGVNGLLVDPGQASQLAGALYRLLTDQELWRNMKHQSWRYVTEHHDIEQHVTELLKIYRTTLADEGHVASLVPS